MIKTGKDLATACENVAKNYKTLYVMGCFGAPMTAGNKIRYINHHSYNRKAATQAKINAASADTFGFDCVCLIKGLLWGWSGDASKIYGGASYGTNGVPDIGADQIINVCKDVSADFSKIQVGELLWMAGHVGIYIGGGKAVECTPAWKGCVQVTTVCNIKSGPGHKWTKHGKLPYVSYEASGAPAASVTPEVSREPAATVSGLPMLQKGSEGSSVKALQILLNGYGYSLGSYGADGDFGSATENAVEAFQEDCNLEVDGIVGPMTWAKLLGV
jgi:hypothetical protein